MNKVPDLRWATLNECDMDKILRLLKRNVIIQDFGGSENEKDEMIQRVAIFGFIKQILIERPSLIHSVANGTVQSHPIVSKYLIHTGVVQNGPDTPKDNYPQKELDILMSY